MRKHNDLVIIKVKKSKSASEANASLLMNFYAYNHVKELVKFRS